MHLGVFKSIKNWVETMKRNITKILFLFVSLLTGIRSLQAGVEKGWNHFKQQEYELAIAEFERVVAQGLNEAASYEGLGWSNY